jgi:hypothetical protein
MVCVRECDRVASLVRRPWPSRGSCAVGGWGGGLNMGPEYLPQNSLLEILNLCSSLNVGDKVSNPYKNSQHYCTVYFKLRVFI